MANFSNRGNRNFPGRRSFNKFSRNRGGNRNGFRKPRKTFHPDTYINKPQESEVSTPITIKNSFSDFPIDNRLKENIIKKGYVTPTPIQDQSIMPILEGRDVIGIAETGTGKTASFLIPLINKVLLDRSQKVLIIVPTRELAVQINDEFRSLSTFLGLTSVLCIGGASINRQLSDLRRNPQFYIATPGRLKDLYQRHFINLKLFKNIVLDEVDRMVDIGFLPDVKLLVSNLPYDRQSLFFSATVTSEVDGILKSFVKNPITVSVKRNDAPKLIEQDIIRVNGPDDKMNKLKEMLRKEEFTKVLIFGRTKHGVEKLSKRLFQQGFSVASIHGNKSQSQRLRTLSMFKRDEIKVLVATDIAARGLDIPDVSHVINYDEPESRTDYIHRIGRTGRAQNKGAAFTFVG